MEFCILKEFLQHTNVCIVVSNTKGDILWANKSFLSWSGYTLAELMKFGWRQLSVPGDDLDADMDTASNWNGFTPIYTVHKQYYRKNREPRWGHMTAMRFPLVGEVEFCLCTWIPKDDDGDEIARVVASLVKMNVAAITKLGDSIEKLTGLSDEQRFVMTATDIVKKYPKLAWGALLIFIGLFGVNNVVHLLQSAQVLPSPVVIQQSSPNP
jgi:PAS domain S-box-containing protein